MVKEKVVSLEGKGQAELIPEVDKYYFFGLLDNSKSVFRDNRIATVVDEMNRVLMALRKCCNAPQINAQIATFDRVTTVEPRPIRDLPNVDLKTLTPVMESPICDRMLWVLDQGKQRIMDGLSVGCSVQCYYALITDGLDTKFNLKTGISRASKRRDSELVQRIAEQVEGGDMVAAIAIDQPNLEHYLTGLGVNPIIPCGADGNEIRVAFEVLSKSVTSTWT